MDTSFGIQFTSQLFQTVRWKAFIIVAASFLLCTNVSAQFRPEEDLNHSLPLSDLLNGVEIKCEIQSEPALSALRRAATQECKQAIIDIACDHLNEGFYPHYIKSECPLRVENGGQYIGCFKDPEERHVLPEHVNMLKMNSPERCVAYCLRFGFTFAGTKKGYECWCGFGLAATFSLKDSYCSVECPGSTDEHCGGHYAIAVYHTGIGAWPDNPTVYISAHDLPPNAVRIAYLITMSGRSLRQIKRLIKAIYHVNDYFFIHIDSRSDYLHRELSIIVEEYDNILIKSKRFSTIWGGASLLKLQLECIEEMLNQENWNWDYFINLSESDFPIKTRVEMVSFLTYYKGLNFLGAATQNYPRFIYNQGLEHTFIECDEHMWMIGSRPLPDGIRIDGGSDWFVLHREFCMYIINEMQTESLVSELLRFWNYSVMAPETFFHTAIQNSHFCLTVAGHNLKHINWKEQANSPCPSTVDWCGFSPHDYTTDDLLNMMLIENQSPLYFARKFEAIVHQEPINILDDLYLGSISEDDPGYNLYWQNDYHADDTITKVEDAKLTYYDSFARLSSEKINKNKTAFFNFMPDKVLEVTLLSIDDKMIDQLVKFQAINMLDEKEYILEAYMTAQSTFKILNQHFMERLVLLEVGSNFDYKENILRNHGNMLGPNSDLGLMHVWKPGPEVSYLTLWLDPSQNIVMTSPLDIPSHNTVGFLKPPLRPPIKPGLWTVRLVYFNDIVAEVQFIVTPLLYKDGKKLAHMHSSRKNCSEQQNKSSDYEFNSYTQDSVDVIVDNLISSIWHVVDTCLITSDPSLIGDTCPIVQDYSQGLLVSPHLAQCQTTWWSSLSPDPKSEFHFLDRETGQIR